MEKKLDSILRSKLKVVDVEATRVGYEFRMCRGNVYLNKKFNRDDPEDWVVMRLRYIYSNNCSHCKLYFYAEPCRLVGGSGFLEVGFAQKICKHWQKLLNVCEKLNKLEIEGSPKEINDCVVDIIVHKKSI